MRVLVTNTRIVGRSGTELYVLDLCRELLRRGHKPVVFSPELGPLVDEFAARTIPVVDDLSKIGAAPDVIHGHHNGPLFAALSWFSSAPAVFFCHDWSAWQDELPLHPRVIRYVAVDETCLDRLLTRSGVSPERAQVIHNFVDCQRFQLRSPLPNRPKRALIFSNYSQKDDRTQAIAQAFKNQGLELASIGLHFQNQADKPEQILGQYDIVLAKGKAAQEAIATGCAVILCDIFGLGPMVTTRNYSQLRSLNFGRRSLQGEVTTEAIESAIGEYNASDARVVATLLRRDNNLVGCVDRLIELYKEVINEHKEAKPDLTGEQRATARLLVQLHEQSKGQPSFRDERQTARLQAEVHWLSQELTRLRDQTATFEERVRVLETPKPTTTQRWLHWIATGKTLES